MRWLLNAVYALLLAVLSPLILWRVFRHGRYRRGLAEKFFGRIPPTSDTRPVVWFHAVSVGEVIQVQKVVEAFRLQTGDAFQILVTTSTDTGYDLAIKRFDGCLVSWFPLDFSWAVAAGIRRVNPHLVVLMELELWPNFLAACHRRGVPVAVVNARMSDRSFGRYQKVRFLLSPLFQKLALLAAQSETYAERLRVLGVPSDRTHVTGSIKFDGVETSRTNSRTSLLRATFGLIEDSVVLMAGSTQEPEESIALDVWQQVRQAHPDVRLILVPRHKERFDAVAELVTSRGYLVARRSAMIEWTSVSAEAVLLLDTIGELGACWGLADIAFVGGSFGNRGGQNMIEPAAYGACVLFGPNTSNFRDVVSLFKASDACVQLETPADFSETVLRLLDNPEERQRLSSAAIAVVQAQQGAIQKTALLLTPLCQTPLYQTSVV